MAFVVADSGATVVVADPGNIEKIMSERANLPAVKTIVYTRKGGKPAIPGTVTYEDVVKSERGKHGDKLPEMQLTWEDNASLMYSSGTTGKAKPHTFSNFALPFLISNPTHLLFSPHTGKPKGVLHGQKSWCMSPMNGAALGLRTMMRAGMIDKLPPADAPAPPQSIFLMACPLFHINGTGLSYGQMLGGAHGVFMYKVGFGFSWRDRSIE